MVVTTDDATINMMQLKYVPGEIESYKSSYKAHLLQLYFSKDLIFAKL